MQPRTKRTVSLPPEVWTRIFHHATDVPGTLIPDIYAHATLIGPIYNKRYHAELRRALITKRALVRVCKKWWHLAIPFLYQSVYIGRARGLLTLLHTLAKSAADKGTMVSTRPLGEYTQRLDVAIRDHITDEYKFLPITFRLMPHLAIAVFAHTFRSPDPANSILDALHFAPSLRVLDWSPVHFRRPISGQMMNDLAKCTQLRILNFPFSVWFEELEHDVIPATVSTLRLSSINATQAILQHSELNIARRSRRPALRELILDPHIRQSHWAATLRAYGPQLDSVHFYMPGFSAVNVGPYLELLEDTCPGLRRLTITSGFRFGSIYPELFLSSVTYLGLNITWSQSKKQEFARFFDVLVEFGLGMPSLRVVQLLNESNVKCLLNSHTKFAVCALKPYMRAASLRIEDRDGVLLTDRLRALGHL